MIDMKYVALIILTNVAAAFLFGRMYERAAWNDPIKKGILPTPRKGK